MDKGFRLGPGGVGPFMFLWENILPVSFVPSNLPGGVERRHVTQGGVAAHRAYGADKELLSILEL